MRQSVTSDSHQPPDGPQTRPLSLVVSSEAVRLDPGGVEGVKSFSQPLPTSRGMGGEDMMPTWQLYSLIIGQLRDDGYSQVSSHFNKANQQKS